MVLRSENFLVYSGAGISTSSGIGDYASNTMIGENENTKPASPMCAQPSLAHRGLKKLGDEGYLKQWINQNHDGLALKCGFPLQLMNEIHGSLYDPTNPVVKMSGSLRSDLFSRLL
jgi:NAD-dependent SIR2 family protein deacetylase